MVEVRVMQFTTNYFAFVAYNNDLDFFACVLRPKVC